MTTTVQYMILADVFEQKFIIAACRWSPLNSGENSTSEVLQGPTV